MDTIEWIKRDLENAKKTSPQKKIPLLLVFVLLPLVLGLGMRASLDHSLEPRVFVPNLIALLLTGFAWFWVDRKNFSRLQGFRLALVFNVLSLGFAIERIFFPIGPRTEYSLPGILEQESLQCFLKGGASSLFVGIYLSIVTLFTASTLSRPARFLLALTAGISGTIMLGFHCDSSSVAHVMWGHVLQGVAAGLLIFGLQEILFLLNLKKSFPRLIQNIKNPTKLG